MDTRKCANCGYVSDPGEEHQCKSEHPLYRIVSQLRTEEFAWEERKRVLQGAIGGKVRVLREERKISLRQLARRLGISAAYLSDMELGRRGPCLETVDRILREL